MTQHKKRRGFTFIELTVAVACVVVILSLLMPALGQVRAAARRSVCKNNLKQVALALHNYHDVHGTFPPGWTSHNWLPAETHGYGWQAVLLPFVEEATIYDQIDFNKPLPKAGGVFQHAFAVYRCPEDATPATNPLRDNYGTSNYSGNYGSTRGFGDNSPLTHWLSPRRARFWPGLESPVPRSNNGIFGHNSRIGFGNITDGTSNTFIVGERSAKSGAGIWAGIRSAELVNDLVTDCSAGNGLNTRYTSFSSEHSGGAQFVFCDGRVKFVSNNINTKIYQALGSRNGGEVIGEF